MRCESVRDTVHLQRGAGQYEAGLQPFDMIDPRGSIKIVICIVPSHQFRIPCRDINIGYRASLKVNRTGFYGGFFFRLFPGSCLEKGITENAIILSGAAECRNSPVPRISTHQPLFYHFRANPFDHGGKGQFRKPFHQSRA